MAGFSLEELLGWMQGTSRINDWDHLLALSGRALNTALRDQHATRLSLGNALRGISGSFEIPDTPGVMVQYHLNDCALDYPVLSFAQVSYVSNNLSVSLQLSGGQKIITHDGAVRSLGTYSLLDGPRLECVVPITFRAASAGQEAQVVCDLAQEGAVFQFMDADTQNERDAGGHFFKQQLQALGERSSYPLVGFADQGNPFMHLERVEIGSQSPEPGSEEGALLLYSTMAHGQAGHKPSNDSGYKYLIPNDPGQDYEFAAQFSASLVSRAGFAVALLDTFGADNFEFVHQRGRARRARATGIRAKAGAFSVPPVNQYKDDRYEYRSEAFELSATQGAAPLSADFEETRVVQHWQTRGRVKVEYRLQSDTSSWTTYTVEFSWRLEQVFQLVNDEFGAGVEGEVFVPQSREPDVVPIDLPDNVSADMRQRIVAFVGHIVKTALLERYSEKLTAEVAPDFLEHTDVADILPLQPSMIAMPRDYVAFGPFASPSGSLRIVPANPSVLAGGRLAFSVEPQRSVVYSLDNLDASNAGTIDAQGNYRAPPRHTLGARPSVQVLLRAEDPQSRESCVTIITVLRQALGVLTDIQVCNPGEQVELAAYSQGDGPLEWQIENPVEGESGTLDLDETSRHCTYTAAGPVAGKTYVLDEVSVTDPASGETASSHVVVLQRTSLLHISADFAGSTPGSVQLQASLNGVPVELGVEWGIGFAGPGTIDSQGLYRADAESTAHFALITAVFNAPVIGTLEGYFILPLPLANAAKVLGRLRR
ncbi:hypothetical protein ACMGT0_23260 [Pseudomonas sp. RHF3.3-3]|uniref:hypothetical protein n=1 Tax=Pseudomonas sp. RHF3.3-3 TaxID=3396624 RepID=UPI003A8B64D3